MNASSQAPPQEEDDDDSLESHLRKLVKKSKQNEERQLDLFEWKEMIEEKLKNVPVSMEKGEIQGLISN